MSIKSSSLKHNLTHYVMPFYLGRGVGFNSAAPNNLEGKRAFANVSLCSRFQ